jgi:peptide deformylase
MEQATPLPRRRAREILREGDPILRAVSREVGEHELQGTAVQQVIDDLIATLKSTTGVGLAAPQIGESLRICVVDKPLTVLVNPILAPIGDVTDVSYEGCLSVPGMRGEVRRPQTVRVQALDRHGKAIDAVWVKFRAIVVQHEVDHLDGILYPERALMMFPDDAAHAPREPQRYQHATAMPDDPLVPVSGKKTFVIESSKPVGGTQHFSWQFHDPGRITDVRISPGGAIVTGAWLSGVRLRAKDYKAGAAARVLVGDHGLVVARGDQLRVELRMPKGKRQIVAEADFE